MNSHFPGMLLKKKRLEREWSQEGLAKGICTVSYLSKIEQGKALASDEILKLLFARLDTVWHDGPDACMQKVWQMPCMTLFFPWKRKI